MEREENRRKNDTIANNPLFFDSRLSGMVSKNLRVQAAQLLPAPCYSYFFFLGAKIMTAESNTSQESL